MMDGLGSDRPLEGHRRDEKAGLARQLLDAFKLINELQVQMRDANRRLALIEKRLDTRPLPDGCEYPDCTPPQEFTGAAEGAMSHVTRPVDDDASEWVKLSDCVAGPDCPYHNEDEVYDREINRWIKKRVS